MLGKSTTPKIWRSEREDGIEALTGTQGYLNAIVIGIDGVTKRCKRGISSVGNSIELQEIGAADVAVVAEDERKVRHARTSTSAKGYLVQDHGCAARSTHRKAGLVQLVAAFIGATGLREGAVQLEDISPEDTILPDVHSERIGPRSSSSR